MVGAACLAGGEGCLAGGRGDVLEGAGGGSTAGAGGACSLLGLVSLEVAALLPASCLEYESMIIEDQVQVSYPAFKPPSSS